MCAAAIMEDNKGSGSWQMEMLMEKLRSKACSFRSLPETAKAIKQSILNKQHILDPGEKAALGNCLDTLQENIKVNSLPAMVERLEATAKQLGLQFTSGTSGPEVYISCDMFYVEVHLQNEGKVRDVKVELAGDQLKPRGQSSPELVECLSSGNFGEFAEHLEGFLSIYKLNTEKKNKCKAYQALQALENDLLKLFEMAQDTINDTHRLIFKSPVGLLINRKGGRSVRMIYFTSPYELLDVASQKSISLTPETAASRDIAHTVSVRIEASASHKLQTTSLVNIIKGNDGLKLPSISGLNASNSVALPAYFCLQLKDPMPVAASLAAKITEVTGISCSETSPKQTLLPLIIQNASKVPADSNNNKGLFVTLPDQQHCYYVSSGPEDLEGVMVSRVPFTHPTSVAHTLEFLRMQAVFNTLITSCFRPDSRQDVEDAFTFEVCAVSHQLISVTFEHPDEESTATAEIDLSDISNVKCRIFTLDKDVAFCSDEYATKVLQRCLSIPVTMRAVIRKVAKDEKEAPLPQGDFVVKTDNSSNPPNDTNQNPKVFVNDFNNLNARRDQAFTPNNVSGVTSKPTTTASTVPGTAPNSMSTNQTNTSPSVSCGTQMLGAAPQKNQFQTHFFPETKVTKVRKRKSGIEPDGKGGKVPEEPDVPKREETKRNTDAALIEASLHLRKDIKVENVTNVSLKRRSSTEGTLNTPGTNELAALREKVYGAGSAANFAKLSYLHNKDTKDSQQPKVKRHKPDVEAKKSPIVLDLTENDKKSSPSSALSAALLKRPGIEIIPIPGTNAPISIPSSITVTPVMKSSDDKYRDKKDRKDKKDIDKKEKKRRRDDSPSGSNHSVSQPSGKSKIQILNQPKSTAITSIENVKGDKSSSGVTMKSSSAFQSPLKNTSITYSVSQQKPGVAKVSLSPSQKSNKLIYSTNQPVTSVTTTSASSKVSSPKSSVSPKNLNLSPKHSSLGKPSMNTLKTSPPFSKPSSLSPKLGKINKDKEKISPSRSTMSPVHISAQSISPSKTKSVSSNIDKVKTGFPDALTITKVSHCDSASPVSLSPTLTTSPSNTSSSLLEKLSLDKAKASPPKNRKGSSLSDIVDKLRAGVTGSSDSLTLIERKEKEKREGGAKKDSDNFMIKPNTGLKFTINKSKTKDGSKSSSSNSQSSSPSKSSAKSVSGLKPGTTSGPASKKSVSNLPPIPKLPSSGVSSNPAHATSNSPLSMTSPLHYNRERQTKEKLQPSEKTKSKDSSSKFSSSETSKEQGSETSQSHVSKGEQSTKRSSTTNVIDSVERNLKNMFGEEADPLASHMEFTETKPVEYLKGSSGAASSTSGAEAKSKKDQGKEEATESAGSMPPPSLPVQQKTGSENQIQTVAVDETSADNEKEFGSDSPLKSNSPTPMAFPLSPSLSIKIVKSPAPVVTSPMNMISPPSISSQPSPCIIDDELMDEALMGARK